MRHDYLVPFDRCGSQQSSQVTYNTCNPAQIRASVTTWIIVQGDAALTTK